MLFLLGYSHMRKKNENLSNSEIVNVKSNHVLLITSLGQNKEFHLKIRNKPSEKWQ